MAYERGTATNQEDLIGKLLTFAVANGWTQDEYDTTNDRAALHRSNCYISMRWDNTNAIGFWQATGFTSGQPPGNHPNDSGNAAQTSGLMTTGRIINQIGNGSFTSYHFFAGTSPSYYLYCVLEFSPGQYRHFGFGLLNKFGDWTGGEFCCAHFWNQNTSYIDVPNSNQHNVMMDSGNEQQAIASCIKIDITALEPDPDTLWGVMIGNASPGTDKAGNPRYACLAGMRTGPFTLAYGWMPTSLSQGFIPLIPLPCMIWKYDTSPDQLYHLGYFPAIRVLNMSAFEPQDEITIGSDIWKIFPMVRKQIMTYDNTEQSAYGGIAYLKS